MKIDTIEAEGEGGIQVYETDGKIEIAIKDHEDEYLVSAVRLTQAEAKHFIAVLQQLIKE